MASSGSDNFTITEQNIIDRSFENAGIKGIGRVLSYEDYARGRMLLNLITKQWMGTSDFAPGLKVWSRKRGYLFPQLNTANYSIGPSGDHVTASYSQTTVSAAEAIGQTVISVTSTTGMTAADYIGIRCTDGSIHWSTISSISAGVSVTIAASLTVAAASGSTVYWYTTKMTMPLKVISLRRKNTSENEDPLSPMLVDEYENISNKGQSGTPSRFLYERGITNGLLKLDFEVSDTTDVYPITLLRPIEDFDSASDNPDYPQEWFRPLVGQLTIDAAVSQGLPVTDGMKLYRDEALAMAQNVDPENQVVFFEPDK